MGKPNGDDSKATARIDLGLQDSIKAGQTALRHLYSRVADKARRLGKERGRKTKQEKRGKGREEASMSCEETGRGTMRKGALRREEMLPNSQG